MATSDVSAKSFMTELMNLSLNLVWKDPYYANTSEDVATRVDMETYIASRNGELRFNSVFQFHEEVLTMFFPDADELALVLGDKRLIPEEMRDAIVQAESEYMINYWENENGETNAYYRMLFGLPPLEMKKSDWIYNTRYADIDMATPVHLLPYTDRLRLENRGYFEELLSQDRYKIDAYGYLKYLGKYRIYPYISRQAEEFQLLYVQQSQYEYLRNDFIDTYEQARRMVLRVYYSDAYRNKSHLYEGFLGLCILFITQQRMLVKYLEADITRNFYDLESLKLVYDAYQVPFYSEIPLKYHERIVKHMNELISYKGSTQVFYDLFELFDFGIMDVFEYYIMKERKVDENGNPVFRDSDGNLLSAEDMWNIRFAKVGWRSDKYVELTDPANVVEYEELTVPDPYWEEDLQLHNKLYQTDWNYFQSKYMGVQIMFELSKLLFEVCYFLGMLRDNRESLSQLTCYYTMIGEDVPIFDMLIYTMTLLCKNAGYTGEIPTDPSSIAAIYGFNFKEYNQLLKMGAETMNDFVLNFKKVCKEYVAANPILAMDATLEFLIDSVTDGAFNWLGEDFPYGEWGYAPPPIFLHDFTPTNNSVINLKKYLKETVDTLNANPDLTDFELQYLYKQLVVKDNFQFCVIQKGSTALDLKYDKFIVKGMDFDDEDLETLRKAVIESYSNMFTWIQRLLEARTALTFDPQIIQMIQDMDIDEVSDIDRVYECMVDLNAYINTKIQQSVNKHDYEAYANLRKILMTTHLMNETFTKRNGTIATTYMDLLADLNPTLYNRIADDELDTLTEEQYAIQTLMRLCDDLTLLESANTSNIKRIVDYLFLILKFFKSAKVDLVSFDIIYLITDRGMNYIKLVSEIWAQEVTCLPNRKDYFRLSDLIWLCLIVQYLMEKLYLVDKDHTMEVGDFIESIFDELFGKVSDKWIEWTVPERMEYLFAEIRSTDIKARIHSSFHWKDVLIKEENGSDDDKPVDWLHYDYLWTVDSEKFRTEETEDPNIPHRYLTVEKSDT